MSTLTASETIVVNASAATTAWLNAFLATGQNEDRPVLYRTICIELFPHGVQFVACDGTLLFRTFVPETQTNTAWPEDFERPLRSVVVMDGSHFALGFVRTLLTVAKAMDYAELSISIEAAPETDGAIPLGSSLSEDVLTLRALGQQLHCRLYEDDYVNWRELRFGIDMADRVDGMKLATRMFAAVGKLKSIEAVECTFTGDEKHIVITGDDSFRGVLMPMRRKEKEKPAPEPTDDEQTDALDDMNATVSVNGRAPVAFTKGNEAQVVDELRQVFSGRDRAAGKD